MYCNYKFWNFLYKVSMIWEQIIEIFNFNWYKKSIRALKGSHGITTIIRNNLKTALN